MRMTDIDTCPPQAKLGYHRSPPSFSYKAREFLQKMALNPDSAHYRVTTKLGAYLFLDRIGVPHAEVYGLLRGIDGLTPRHVRRPVVLKPLDGCSAAGVMVLRPQDGGWYDTLAQRHWDFDDIVARARAAMVKRGLPDVWLLEEPLVADGGVPDDLKFYTFQGDIALVLQRRSRPGSSRPLASYRWFDADWEPVETGKHPEKIDTALEPPEQRDALADLALKVSEASPYAFTRVDTFATDRGPRVGEVNAWVGGYDHFSQEWDLRLGAAWEAAELRVPARVRPIPQSVPEGGYPLPWWRF
ncbi:ATP-grasp fold amidoligase family protein [Nocardiopsis sp. Huas11]|uniref:ATP-grasp fold amidoligase family protein n=1 Tax=Nocardiopsis sp. Huas11 TaxID=2183912 RepID=UPI0013158B9D|nr:ATP-grasp fold amidoligase family protein [Nocardiopsis sp. Huas11]